MTSPHIGRARTLIPIAVDGEYAGYIAVADTIRPESIKAIENLRKLGIAKILLITRQQISWRKNRKKTRSLRDTLRNTTREKT